MQPRPSFERELLIPIAVGVVSILGLAWIFLANYRREAPVPPTVEPTAALFDVSPVATRTRTPRPSATSTLEETSPIATGTSPDSYPGPPDATIASAGTATAESRSPASATSTPERGQPLLVGRYDNTDPNIIYDRHWTYRMNSGTKFAYKGTLHISDSIGNEAFFRFTGERFIFGYQRGRSFGTVTVLIDDQPYSFHEQAFGNIWRSPQLSPGTHFVRIIHESGQSINLDYIEVVR
jgi:hypothetical protein